MIALEVAIAVGFLASACWTSYEGIAIVDIVDVVDGTCRGNSREPGRVCRSMYVQDSLAGVAREGLCVSQPIRGAARSAIVPVRTVTVYGCPEISNPCERP